jgi:ABC-type sugar transport system ATPase subunit
MPTAEVKSAVLRGASDKVIEVEHLTKYYGPLPAMDHISFAVQQGEVFGFLGLNGSIRSKCRQRSRT